MRPGRCSADLRNLRRCCVILSVSETVGSPGRFTGAVGETRVSDRTKRDERGERTWQSRAAWWAARSHPRRAETPPSRPRGRPRTPCQPWGAGGRGDRKGRGGRSVSGRRPTSATRKMELNWEGSREMLHPRGSRDERGRTGVMCGMVSPGNVAAMVMKSFAACETCMGSISSGARHRPETNGAR